ncbi:uncharacterized protein LOC120351134 [Nilaparvata lugens]|uniref:uncharacterized protein LOC120351134 n=1 Tax=Nilaparvata lugens TaxID=108931 RepID=UPI00193D8A42|nr:uncharacterized protein LOC120351134 [Nilaparvata lugens]
MLDAYLKGNYYTEDTKLDILVTLLSAENYKLIIDCTTFEESISILEGIFIKKKSEIFTRYLLSIRKQKQGESIDNFFLKLKELSLECNFTAISATENREEHIKEALIAGLYSSEIRQRILESPDMSLHETLNRARAFESAKDQSQCYNKSNPPFELNACKDTENASNLIPNQKNTSDSSLSAVSISGQACFFCGNKKHSRLFCPAKNEFCKKCGKKGHFARVCNSKSSVLEKKREFSNSILLTPSVQAEKCLSKVIIPITINGTESQALIDTGATGNFIDDTYAKKLNLEVIPEIGKVTLGSKRFTPQIRGKVNVNLTVQGESYTNTTLMLMQDLCENIILGHEFMNNFSSIEIPFGGNKPPLTICGITQAKIPPCSLFQHLKPNCQPITTKSRKLSKDDEDFISNEIQQLLEDGIIEESHTPWRAQAFVVKPDNRKKGWL